MVFDPTAGTGSTIVTSFDDRSLRLDGKEQQYVAAKRARYIEQEQERSLRDINVLMRSNRNRSFS